MKVLDDKKAEKKSPKKSLKEGLSDGWTRTTIVIRETHLETLKNVAWAKKTTVKELLEKLINDYTESDEAQSILSIVSKLQSLQNNPTEN